MTKNEKIDKLRFILDCYKNFVEASQGKAAVNQMVKAAEMEYAVMRTNDMLEIRTMEEFEDALQRNKI